MELVNPSGRFDASPGLPAHFRVQDGWLQNGDVQSWQISRQRYNYGSAQLNRTRQWQRWKLLAGHDG